MVLELVLAGACGTLGLRALLTPARVGDPSELSGRDRVMIAVHEAARAGFWFSLAGLFVGFALVDDPRSLSWLAVVPVILAGVRMLAAVRLSRG